jgi:tetratricopeptide (TPR) repeat protein
MKRYIVIFLIPVLTAISFSCQDRLDIVPNQSLAPELALKSEGDLVALLVGAYDGLQSVDLYGGGVQMMADIWANRYYLRFRGTFNYLLQIASVTSTSNFILTDNAGARDIWANAYRTINICNLVLANLSLSEGNLRPTSSVEGEALFIRGSLYFELARLYGRAWGDGDENVNLAVPIILTPTPYNTNDLTPSNYPDRSTVAAVYAQALSDLEAAADLLPETNQYYATKWAAYAQLSRIALMQEDYAAARDYANMVIESNRYSLTDQFSNLWYNYIRFGGVAPLEYIFYIRVSTQDGTNGLNTYYGQTIGSIPGSAGRGDLDAQATWRNRYDVNDARRFYIAGSSGRQLTQKHIDRFGHVPVIRLAEMYLTRAEGNFREGTSVGATPFDDINAIRDRAGISLLADPGDLTIDLILEERELELAYEGHYLHDLKRTRRSAPGSNPDPVAGNPVPWDSPKLIFPIPQREVDVNPNLIQNEGYD